MVDYRTNVLGTGKSKPSRRAYAPRAVGRLPEDIFGVLPMPALHCVCYPIYNIAVV
jgi:hypothetical protein